MEDTSSTSLEERGFTLPEPRSVFDDPDAFLTFLTLKTDSEFEGQSFDRKEAGRFAGDDRARKGELRKLREHIKETVSAFSNRSRAGGLLVLGVSSTGDISGVDHLTEEELNSLTNLGTQLRNQSVAIKPHCLPSGEGESRTVCLYFVEFCAVAICEDLRSRFWVRVGAQNVLGDQNAREQLFREKGILPFDSQPCVLFDRGLLDQAVVEQYRRSRPDADSSQSVERLLCSDGALCKSAGRDYFTNAGYLFFCSNPLAAMPGRSIRLLQFGVDVADRANRGLPIKEKEFTGPIPQQLRAIRTFLREGSFFKTYQVRRPEGGFAEEEELPLIAVDEAIVNAVAHRDYGFSEPILCESYRDALLIRNHGIVQQTDRNLPTQFSLDDLTLESRARNPHIMSWLRTMRDSGGQSFVKALSEGTRRMHEEMSSAGLPAPTFTLEGGVTTLTLFSNARQREENLRKGAASPTECFANLFSLTVSTLEGTPAPSSILREQRSEGLAAIRDALVGKGWFPDRLSRGTLEVHRRGHELQVPETARRAVRFYPGYSLQLRTYGDCDYLCVDYCLQVRTVVRADRLLARFSTDQLVGLRCMAEWDGWKVGQIVSTDGERARVRFLEFEAEEIVPLAQVIPSLPLRMTRTLLQAEAPSFDFHRERKRHSLGLQPDSSRVRASKTAAFVEELVRDVFPLELASFRIDLSEQPATLCGSAAEHRALSQGALPEPAVEFDERQQSPNIREGITKFRAYEHTPRSIELIPVCIDAQRERMTALIERLRTGRMKYRGSERTFGTRLTYRTITTASNSQAVYSECKRLLEENSDWIGDQALDRIFLVHTPDEGFSRDDEASPYYTTKRLLLERGVPCQMLDTRTLKDPEYKDLNLALNITAKCGVTPWVLPDRIPDADFFVGLSQTQSRQNPRDRIMGCANVFSSYGKWEFYSANAEPFSFQDRHEHWRALVIDTLRRLDLSDAPHIYFHYSKRFSAADRAVLLEASRSVRPRGTFTFVWINSGHRVRFYDSRPETNGSLARGRYVVGSPNQVYVSTTGWNQFRKTLGTPHALEVNVRTESPRQNCRDRPDLKSVALQVLSLTKLNWASTDSLCAEPITTKFAHDIAYLTGAFLRQTGDFRLHPVLERTPWFI